MDDLFLTGAGGKPTVEEALPANKLVKKEIAVWDAAPASSSDTDTIEFWKDYTRNAPYLANVARSLCGIPGSSAAMERAWSHAGRAVNPRRAMLDPARAETLIFGHENIIRNLF